MAFDPDAPAKAVSQIQQSLAKLAKQHQDLIQGMGVYTRDASLAFVNLRLERDSQALEKLQSCHGLTGMIGVQQEWLRGLVTDYAEQNMRLATAMRDLAHEALAGAGTFGEEVADQAAATAEQAVEEAEPATVVGDNVAYADDPQH